MNEENVPDEEFRRDLTPIEEEMIHNMEETTRLLMGKARANELRKRFATPPPMKRIEIGPKPMIPELQFPEPPLLPKPGLTEADKEAMRQAISQMLTYINKTASEMIVAVGPLWREMVEELEKTFDGIKVVVRELPDERDIHPGELRDERDIHPGELRDERGIKQPSHTPPFWAATPGRTSKKRGKR